MCLLAAGLCAAIHGRLSGAAEALFHFRAYQRREPVAATISAKTIEGRPTHPAATCVPGASFGENQRSRHGARTGSSPFTPLAMAMSR